MVALTYQQISDEYQERLISEFWIRVKTWQLRFDEEEKFTVTSGLLSRQTTLCLSIVRDEKMWNWDLGLMVIRLMAEVHINIAWLSGDPLNRAQKFIEYGAGQGLLDLEHKRIFASKGEISRESLKAAEDWLASQRKELFTEVNLASWSGLSVSKMAEEANVLDIYERFYVPACSPLHATWFFLSHAHLRKTEEAGAEEWIPVCYQPNFHPEILSLSARLMDKTFLVADSIFAVDKIAHQSSLEWLLSQLRMKQKKA